MTDIISHWLENCIYGSLQAYKALAQAGYQHDWIRHGDLGGIRARIDGRFFEPDRYGEFWVAQPIWVEQPTAFHYVENPILEDIIAWQPAQPPSARDRGNARHYRGQCLQAAAVHLNNSRRVARNPRAAIWQSARRRDRLTRQSASQRPRERLPASISQIR